MAWFRQFIRRPQRVWLRQLNFLVHLWLGMILALYLIVIGITGSILVFRAELEALGGQNPQRSRHASEPPADIGQVIHNIEASYPGRPIISVFSPTETDPLFVAVVQGRRGRIAVAADPTTGEILGELPGSKSWLTFVRDLHVALLGGRRGRTINGIGAAVLLLLNITGLVIWWPGIRSWKRALTVDFRRTWRRINFDLHRALGFWTLAIVSFWAISGVYFGWPDQVLAFVNRLSPIVSAKPPVVTVRPASNATGVDLHSIIAQAYALDAGTTLIGIEWPYNRRAPLEILMRRGKGIGREYTDTLYFNPWTGAHITTWRYGINETLGDWLIWSQVPLHYGTYWGFGVKVLWSLLGLTIPVITITGILMYWNRVLRRKWKHLKNASRSDGMPGA
jgi:uncharacterized iron-regulated membrane protein